MRRLAQEAGVTPRTLYAYFAAKRDILQHIWEVFFIDLFDQIDEIAQSNHSARDRLRASCLLYIDYWEAHDDRYDLVFMADSVSQSDVGVFLDNSAIVERYTVFSQLLDAAAGREADAGDLTQLNALICALDGIAHNKVTKSYYDWGSLARIQSCGNAQKRFDPFILRQVNGLPDPQQEICFKVVQFAVGQGNLPKVSHDLTSFLKIEILLDGFRENPIGIGLFMAVLCNSEEFLNLIRLELKSGVNDINNALAFRLIKVGIEPRKLYHQGGRRNRGAIKLLLLLVLVLSCAYRLQRPFSKPFEHDRPPSPLAAASEPE
eukprot:s1_g1328.t1